MPDCALPPTATFCSSFTDTPRSRSVSRVVLSGRVQLKPLPARLLADWEVETHDNLALEIGDVEVMPLARARTRWPDFRLCVAEAGRWLASHGVSGDLLGEENRALMVCLGARDHHDGERYAGAAFFNLFVSEDVGLDLHFAATGQRIPLERGTAVVFDTCQPHAVIRRGSTGFDAANFTARTDWKQFFLTWELPIEAPALARVLQIEFDLPPRA